MLTFAKISATGNDFVAIDNRTGIFVPEPTVIQKICARRTGVGANGLLLLEASTKQDFSMRYFNSDGSEGELCGNGARAIALFAYLQGAVASHTMVFASASGIHRARVGKEAVEVEMPKPQNLIWEVEAAERFGYHTVGHVEIGVPHLIVEVKELPSVPVVLHGRELRHDRQFPKGTNVDFIQIVSPHRIKMRTYERGVEDETLACGTGATAASVLSFLKKRVAPPVTVEVPGGELIVTFQPNLNELFLKGTVHLLYVGTLFLEKDQWMPLTQLEKNFRTLKK